MDFSERLRNLEGGGARDWVELVLTTGVVLRKVWKSLEIKVDALRKLCKSLDVSEEFYLFCPL